MLVLLLASLATAGCSLLAPGPQVVIDIEPSATPTSTHTPTPTWPAAWTPTPTFTPWPATPTPTVTYTPIPTSTSRPVGARSVRPRASLSGPLTFEFELNGKWCVGDEAYIAEFTLSASGGGGGYTYYHDILPIEGPTNDAVKYQLDWAKCGGAPGTFFVESADGQRVSELFWVHPPSCCR
jgi:hypothetical protein